MKIAVVSGGFDPIHSGHINYLQSAAEIGDKVIVCLNSDNWLNQKKGKFFLPFDERKLILENLNMVTEVISFEDDENGSAINGLKKVQKIYPNEKIIFCNGGDRNEKNIPEMKMKGIDFSFGIGGGNKINSSSWILKNWSFDSEERIWGKFFTLFQDKGIKVKELIIMPRKKMSFQRHTLRNEIWLVSRGSCVVNFSEKDPNLKNEIHLKHHDYFVVRAMNWHQITNPNDVQCNILEIQYGEETIEEDIERLIQK